MLVQFSIQDRHFPFHSKSEVQAMKLRKIRIIQAIIFIPLTLPLALLADTVELRNGKELEGILVGQTRYKIQLNVGGRIQVIHKKRIRRIRYRPTQEEVKKTEKLKEQIARARKSQAKMKEKKTRRSEKIDKAILNLEQMLREEEVRQEKEMERRKTLAANLENEIKKLDDESKKIEEEMKRLEERKKAIAEQKFEMENERRRRQGEKELEKTAEEKNVTVNTETGAKKTTGIQVVGATPFGSLWRSAVIPGWGQTYSGNSRKGWFFLGTTLFLGGAVLSARSAHTAAINDRDSPAAFGFLLSADPAYLPASLLLVARDNANQSKVEQAADRYRTASLLLAGFYLYNVFDAWFFSDSSGAEKLAGLKKGHVAQGFRMDVVSLRGPEMRNGLENRAELSYRVRF